MRLRVMPLAAASVFWRRPGLVPVDLLVGAQVERRRVVLPVGRAELSVGRDGLVLEVHHELVPVGQAGTVERVATPQLASHVHVQLAGGRVLLSLGVGHVALVEADDRVLPGEQPEPRQLLRLPVGRNAEGTALVAVLLVAEVDLAVVAAAALPVVELAGLAEDSSSRSGRTARAGPATAWSRTDASRSSSSARPGRRGPAPPPPRATASRSSTPTRRRRSRRAAAPRPDPGV